MANEPWYIGDRPAVTAYFTDGAGAAADPDALTVKVKTPAGAITTWTYPASPQIVRAGVGQYTFRFDLTLAGIWCYRVEATGALMVAREGTVPVERSNF